MRRYQTVTEGEIASLLADVLSDVLREDCRIDGFQETHHYRPERTEIEFSVTYYNE